MNTNLLVITANKQGSGQCGTELSRQQNNLF